MLLWPTLKDLLDYWKFDREGGVANNQEPCLEGTPYLAFVFYVSDDRTPKEEQVYYFTCSCECFVNRTFVHSSFLGLLVLDRYQPYCSEVGVQFLGSRFSQLEILAIPVTDLNMQAIDVTAILGGFRQFLIGLSHHLQ